MSAGYQLARLKYVFSLAWWVIWPEPPLNCSETQQNL